MLLPPPLCRLLVWVRQLLRPSGPKSDGELELRALFWDIEIPKRRRCRCPERASPSMEPAIPVLPNSCEARTTVRELMG